MALRVLDGNQSATTLSSVVTGGEHIVAHTVVSLGSTAISNITSAVSGSVVSVSNFPSTQTVAGTVTANVGTSIGRDVIEVLSDNFLAGSYKRTGLAPEYKNTSFNETFGPDIILKLVTTGPYNGQFAFYYDEYSPEAPQCYADDVTSNINEVTGWSGSNPIQSARYVAPLPVSLINNPLSVTTLGHIRVNVANSVTIGNSVTVGSLPAISGTVTANLQINSRRAVYVNSPGYPKLTGVYVASSNLDNRPDYLATFANHLIVYNEGVDTNRWSIQDSDTGTLIYRSTTTGGLDPANLSWEKSADTATTYSPFPTVQGLSETVIASLPAISGTVTVGNSVTIGSLPTLTPQLPRVTFIDGSGSVTTANTAITVFASSSTRSYLLVQVTTGSAFVNVGATATTVNGISLTAGQGYAWETTIPQGAVSLISTTTSSRWVAKEA